MNGFHISSITHPVAKQIASDRFFLDYFFRDSYPGEWIHFSHYNFFYNLCCEEKRLYSKTAPAKHVLQFHKLHITCDACGSKPERNYAGIGTMILVKTKDPRRVRILCFEHRHQFTPFVKTTGKYIMRKSGVVEWIPPANKNNQLAFL